MFPHYPQPEERGPRHPWVQLVGPPLCTPPLPAIKALPGAPRGWQWPPPLHNDVLHWVGCLQWRQQPGEVSFAELALDFEEFTRAALPAPPEQWHRGLALSLHERARVLRHALRALQDPARQGHGGTSCEHT